MKNKTRTSDMVGLTLPQPTKEKPMAQLDFVFDRIKETKPASSAGMFRYALSYYKNVYLANVHNYNSDLEKNKLFYLREQWDSFALLKVQTFLDTFNVEGNPDRIASSTVTGLVSCLRQTMKYAALHGFIDGEYLHAIALPPPQAETTQNAAYSDEEIDRINEFLHRELKHSHNIVRAKGYQVTGLGQDPRRYYGKVFKTKHKLVQKEWQNVDNLRWYFENVMKCKANCKATIIYNQHYYFYYFASKFPGGYNQLMADWEVKFAVNLDVIMPLVLKLSFETGLNPTSILNLTTDCFQEHHPLSGVPYLQYYKARSKGHMEMHLNVYDKEASIREFKQGQANIIRKTIELIKEVTAPLRAEVSDDLSKLLFIYESPKHASQKEKDAEFSIQAINDNWTTSQWCCAQVESNNMLADNGTKLQLNLSRFRSTKVTDMVRKGFDFFEIQTHFGHTSIKTTLRYIARHNLEIKAQKEISKVLKGIHDNICWQKENKPQYATAETKKYDNNIVYKSINGDCRNIYDPPEEVKRLKGYDPNQACTRFNMCLFCKNVVLMKHHLPTLIIYQRQIQQATDYNLTEFPNHHHYERTLGVLNNLLDPKTSQFSREELDWARAVAECSDEFIDPVVYRPNL